jgi:hypothetical protein
MTPVTSVPAALSAAGKAERPGGAPPEGCAMTRWLALVAAELRQRRLLFAGSGLLGLLALAAPAVPALAGHSPTEVRSTTALFLLALWTPLVALAAGATAVGGEIADRRIGFYLARPLSSWALWGGKLGAAALLPLLAGLLILLPVALAGGVFFGIGPPAARLEDLPPSLWPAAALVLIALVALGHAAGIALRSRSVWLLCDLAALGLGAALVAEAVRTLYLSLAVRAAEVGGLALAGLALAALLAAGAVAVERGRDDLAAAHRALSLALWPAVLAGALGFVLFSRWVVGAPIDSLADGGHAGSPPGAGRWVVVGGEAEHRFGYRTAFFFDSGSGRAVRLGKSWTTPPQVAVDGSRAVWLAVEPEGWQPWSLDLRAPAARPRRIMTGLADWPPRFALSPRGARLATIVDQRLLVYDLDGDKLLASVPVAPWALEPRMAFLDEDRLRLLALRTDGRRADLDIEDLAIGTRRLVRRARIEPPDVFGDWRLDPSGDRLLVHSAHKEGMAAPLRLFDLTTGEALGGLARRPALDAAFLADGRIVTWEPSPGGQVLRLFSRDGEELRAYALPGARALDVGGQPDAGSLVVAGAACRSGRSAGCWIAYRLDLASGARRSLGRGLRPLADPPALGPAAHLFRAGDAPLVEVDERGERRVLLPRGS